MADLSVTLAGVTLKNPIIPASGTFGYGREFADAYDLDLLGSFSWKGTTAAPRDGNPQPRIAETAGGMLNAVGLQNPGIDAVIREEVPRIAKIFRGPVIANVGGFTLDEYTENCRKLDGVEQAAIKAVEAVDACVGRAVEAVKEADGVMFICADHGNAEQLVDYETGAPFTAHTTNPVPFILVNADPAYKLREGGCLADIVPTLIELMGMEQPAEMTGKSLLVK